MTDDLMVILHQAGIGTIAVYLLQWLKGQKWFPWISHNSATINRWVGVAVALGTSIGIKIVAQGSSSTGWHFVIDVPMLSVLLDTAVHAASQFAGQQILYHSAVATPAALADVPKQ